MKLTHIVNFFKCKTGKTAPASVSLQSLESWFAAQQENLLIKKELQNELDNYLNSLKDARWDIDNSIDEWEKNLVIIEEKDLREEASQIFSETRSVLSLMTPPDSMSLEQALKFHNIISKEVELLLQQVEQANISFLGPPNHLFEKLLSLSAKQGNFEQKCAASGLQKLLVLKNKAKQIQAAAEKIRELSEKIADKQERLKQSNLKLAEKERELQLLKQSSGYQELFAQKEKRQQIIFQRNELQDTIHVFFTLLRPALEEQGSELVKNYVKDPLSAFLQDSELKIQPLLLELEKQIREHHSDLTINQVQQVLPQLEKIGSGYLEELRQQYLSIKEEFEKINTEMKEPTLLLRVEDAHYRLEHFRTQVERLAEELSASEEEQRQHEEMQRREKEFLKEQLKISFQIELQD